MKKLLFCLGVTKGGTTWLHWSLCRHPEIARIPRKEIHYFLRQYGGVDRLTDTGRMSQFATFVRQSRLTSEDTDHLVNIEGSDPDQYGSPWDEAMRKAWSDGGRSLGRYNGFVHSMDWYKQYLRGPVDDQWYEALFERVPEDKWPIDFSTTNYLVNDRGFARMASIAEDSRAIIILRDPIERLWSHVKFHAEITRDLDKLPNWSVNELRDFIAHFKLADGSFYSKSIRNLFDHFPPERRLVLNFEDLRKRPDALFAEVLDFLDLAPMPLPRRSSQEPRINASKSVSMPRGAVAHLAPRFEEDLEQLVSMGVDFARPWITNARAFANEKPEPPARRGWGLRSLVGN